MDAGGLESSFHVGLKGTNVEHAEAIQQLILDTLRAVVRDGTHTRYELALPWRELGSYAPKAGRIFGFGFVVMNSNDGETARYWLQFTPGICGGKDPSQYADFVLVE